MSMNLKSGVLVQGEVTLKILVDTLVDVNTYADEDRLKDFLLDMALKELDGSDEEVEVINDVDVILTKETFDEFERCLLSEDDWSKIIQEKRKYLKS